MVELEVFPGIGFKLRLLSEHLEQNQIGVFVFVLLQQRELLPVRKSMLGVKLLKVFNLIKLWIPIRFIYKYSLFTIAASFVLGRAVLLAANRAKSFRRDFLGVGASSWFWTAVFCCLEPGLLWTYACLVECMGQLLVLSRPTLFWDLKHLQAWNLAKIGSDSNILPLYWDAFCQAAFNLSWDRVETVCWHCSSDFQGKNGKLD